MNASIRNQNEAERKTTEEYRRTFEVASNINPLSETAQGGEVTAFRKVPYIDGGARQYGYPDFSTAFGRGQVLITRKCPWQQQSPLLAFSPARRERPHGRRSPPAPSAPVGSIHTCPVLSRSLSCH